MRTYRVPTFPRTRGFTVVELLIVVLLISIFLTFASVNWDVTSKRGKDALLENLSSAVSQMREEAIANYERRVIEIDLTTAKILVGAVDRSISLPQ